MGYRNTLLALLLVFLPACTTVGVTTVGKPELDHGEYCHLDVFTSEAEVGRPFRVVCLIDSRTGTTAFHDRTAAAAIRHAKPEACKCGANAIIIAGVATDGVTAWTWGEGKAIIKAIKYLRQPAQGRRGNRNRHPEYSDGICESCDL